MSLAWLNNLLSSGIELGATDFHITDGQETYVRVAGQLILLPGFKGQQTHFSGVIKHLCSDIQRGILEKQHAVDLALSHPNKTRFRINIYRERGRWAMAARTLPSSIRSLSEMGLPTSLSKFAMLHSGLVLVTGATGSGKSTTLAVLLDLINQQRHCHILTVEDPVEYRHEAKKALIHQRELHADAVNYASAVRSALRQDPDVLLIGEMRDLETMRCAMSAAETGHLVFSTLHCSDSVGAINRIIGSFPAAEQSLVRQQLSLVLQAVLTQRLLPDRLFQQRHPALEILCVNSAVSNMIRNNKPEQLYSILESSRNDGMQTLEQSLAALVNNGRVSLEQARFQANRPESMQRYIKVDNEAKAINTKTSIRQGMTFEPL